MIKKTNQINKNQNLENEFYIIGLCLGIAALPCIYLYRYLTEHIWLFGLPCMLHALTGYYCPGCGGTRSVYALFHGHLWRSFCYHPLVPYTAVIYFWFMFSQSVQRISHNRIGIGMRMRMCWLWTALAILAVNTIVKNACLLAGIDLLIK